MFTNSSSRVTEGIRVQVRSLYLNDDSSPEQDYFMFAYKVLIVNESPYKVQLLRRQWQITDGLGQKRSVSGEGVVGLQPVLAPGESHEYISGCNFCTPIGRMEGFYFFIRSSDNAEFKVRIPKFILACPFTLN